MYEHKPILAGTFYPADPQTLAASVDACFLHGKANAERTGLVREAARITMLPHAGHVYCGNVIGDTLTVTTLPKTVVILCPSHTGQGAPLAVWPEGAWQTPLGSVPVDAALAAALIDSDGGYAADVRAHAREHSIEVLLPFLQRAIPDLTIVPVVVSVNPAQLQSAGECLALAVQHYEQNGQNVAILVSSDMHHYDDETVTLQMDDVVIDLILRRDPVDLFNTVVRRKISMCGIQPTTLALFAASVFGLERTRLVAHTTSAEASGDTSRVVGYAGINIL